MSQSNNRDPAANQLQRYKEESKDHPARLTTGWGAPVDDKANSLTAGARGPILLQDTVLIDELSHFDRERIPERVVHAKGAGAFGYFEVTKDISNHCKASVFSKVGKQTPVAVRFSTVGGESGSADTARDPRGFAIKFYTEDGNWDLVGNNTPIFFIRDPIFFPSFIHTQKRNPVTHCKDPDAFWDFVTLRPETTHQMTFLFSDRGTPFGYTHMNGYGSHTFKMVNANGKAVYCKFHLKTDQGVINFDRHQADEMAKQDPDFSIRDLFNNISEGKSPSWTMYIQVMTFEEAERCSFNPFDLTKVWSHADYPLKEVGRMTLNRNPKNYFAEVEQAAFSPANMVPGIEPSPDKMLHGRLFSYDDTHRHRLGANFGQIPVNCPYKTKVSNYQRDGPMCVDNNQEGAPNYFPNSFSGPQDDKKAFPQHIFQASGDVARHDTADDDNFSQVTAFWTKVLSTKEKDRLVDNIAQHVSAAQGFIQERVIKQFGQVHKDFGKGIQDRLEFYNNQAKTSKIAHL